MSLKVEEIQSEVEDRESDFSPYKIICYPADYTLKGLYDKWKDNEIVIPPFQRQYVWTIKQASRLIESFLLGLPVPGVFFYRERNSQRLLVIDGQQRLRSVFGYFEDRIPESNQKFSLRGVRANWDGMSFADLGSADQIRLRDTVLRATIVDQIDPKDDTSMFHIFERLNTSGTVLSPQEIRNCLYRGPFNDLLHKLNKHQPWREILGTGQPDKRMKDIELILRVIALAENSRNYFKPMKEFMSQFMKKPKLVSDDIPRYENTFRNAVDKVLESLGPKPFHIKRGLNTAVFDSVAVAFYLYRDGCPSNIKERYSTLLANDAYQSYTATATTDVDTVKSRLELAQRYLFK